MTVPEWVMYLSYITALLQAASSLVVIIAVVAVPRILIKAINNKNDLPNVSLARRLSDMEIYQAKHGINIQNNRIAIDKLIKERGQ